MLETRQCGDLREIAATQGWLRLKGSRDFTPVRRCVMLPSQTPDDFEEITELPLYTEAEYASLVTSLIRRRYSADDEIALINNVMANVTGERQAEYAAYQDYRDLCKAEARRQLEAAAQPGDTDAEPQDTERP